jgi:hypothetical protein
MVPALRCQSLVPITIEKNGNTRNGEEVVPIAGTEYMRWTDPSDDNADDSGQSQIAESGQYTFLRFILQGRLSRP